MAETIQMQQRSAGSYLATVELWRQPDGSIAALLSVMPPHVIETRSAPTERLCLLAHWMEQGAEHLRQEAQKMADDT